ncbi:hypothetical protein [Microbacterium lacticum]
MKSSTKKKLGAAAVATTLVSTALIVGFGSGSAFAQISGLLAPAGVSAGPNIDTQSMPSPSYPVNKNGLTYGSALNAPSPDEEPDLIRVVDDAGKEGYVRKVELDDANGATAAGRFTSPQEALAWQRERQALDSAPTVTVYASDGVTITGTFTISLDNRPGPGYGDGEKLP